jgi:hypothetical protein
LADIYSLVRQLLKYWLKMRRPAQTVLGVKKSTSNLQIQDTAKGRGNEDKLRTIIMTRKFWLKLGKAPQLHVRRALDNRIVFCANCEANRTLGVSSSGNLSCSSCGSENWMYLSAPIIANFREYDERKVQERIAVDRYMDKLEREVFFTPNGALV